LYKYLHEYADSGKNHYSLFRFGFLFSAPAGICECKAYKQKAKTKRFEY